MRPVMVSVDRPAVANATFRVHAVPFTMLSDPDLQLHEAFRVVHRVDDELAQQYKTFGIDLEASSGRSHHSIAIPSLFLVDREGRVRWAHADRDHRTRPSVAQILEVLDGLKLRPPK